MPKLTSVAAPLLLLLQLHLPAEGKALRCNFAHVQDAVACEVQLDPPPPNPDHFWMDEAGYTTRGFSDLPRSALTRFSKPLTDCVAVTVTPHAVPVGGGTLTWACDEGFMRRRGKKAGTGGCDAFAWVHRCHGCTNGTAGEAFAGQFQQGAWRKTHCATAFVLDAAVPTASHPFVVFHAELRVGENVSVSLPPGVRFAFWGKRYRTAYCGDRLTEEACREAGDYDECVWDPTRQSCSSFRCEASEQDSPCSCVADEQSFIDAQL